jgi:uncharacterized protein (DUF2384 family)
MTDAADYKTVERTARSIFGGAADLWLLKPNRHLAQLSPAELAQSAAGARVVLSELARAMPIEDVEQK